MTDRNDLPEYSDYGDNAERLKNIGQVFPVIFFLVAALVSLTTMTRMVEEQRTQIGTMKALGYENMRGLPDEVAQYHRLFRQLCDLYYEQGCLRHALIDEADYQEMVLAILADIFMEVKMRKKFLK